MRIIITKIATQATCEFAVMALWRTKRTLVIKMNR